jgi:hypothetical protein
MRSIQNNEFSILFPKVVQTTQIFRAVYGWSGGDASHKIGLDNTLDGSVNAATNSP